MRPTTTALQLLVAGTSLVSAFVVPDSLNDGIYAVSFDPSTGEALSDFEQLPDVPALSKRAMRIQPLSTRQGGGAPPPLEKPKTTCGNKDLNRDDFNSAKESFTKLCDDPKQYAARNAIIITQGGAIAYMCNYAAENRCWRQEYEEASSLIDKQCSNRRSGTVYVDKWKKSYGRDVAGADICLDP